MRARIKRRQTVRRLEIIAVVAVVVVSLVVGFYLALNTNSNDALDGKGVFTTDLTDLRQTSLTSYGASGSGYLTDVHALTDQTIFSTNGKPIVVYVGADYCLYCAVQRWSLIMALMRFGNFTGLEYMHSSVGDGNYATFTFSNSSYQSPYIVFQPYEVYDRAGNALATLPTNYTSSLTQYGKSSFPFLNFADEYYISGAILDPKILGTKNQTQIISSIQAGDTLGNQIKQAANVITAVICRLTNNKPSSVCNDPSITLTVSYTPSSTSSGSELLLTYAPFTVLPDTFIAGRPHSGWN